MSISEKYRRKVRRTKLYQKVYNNFIVMKMRYPSLQDSIDEISISTR